MDIGEIIKDAMRYPLTNWKNYFILGTLLTFASLYTSIYSTPGSVTHSNIGNVIILALFGFLFSIMTYGYSIKIINSSLSGFGELPDFHNWFNIFISGLKVLVVGITFMIPLVLILFVSILLLGISIISSGITNAHDPKLAFYVFVIFGIVILYMLFIIPFFLMSITNMAYNGGAIEEAFSFGKIFKRISKIGWINFLVWYIVTGIIYLVLSFIGLVLRYLFDSSHLNVVGGVFYSLIMFSFIFIFIFRSTALFYMSGATRYLECENCGGYYELQKGESPGDFETDCTCGGKLNSFYSYDGNPANFEEQKTSKTSIKDYTKKMDIKNLEKSIEKSDDGYRFNFKEVPTNILAGIIQESFEEDGYKLEEGTPTNGVYGVGSHMNRMLAGAFSKRFKFRVDIYPVDNNSYLRITKAMSGWSGGYMAVRSLNNEYKRILFKINSM